uniref:Secreted venom protein family 3 protein n=1 Tax=Pristhesancus plagipennis TaxID=1955184 RepID=A0A2K8JMK6_PRIPG|nr:secreted venom protein family 3 protein [Pristhesancus plagipennis]
MDTKLVILLVLGIVAIAWAGPETACSGESHNLISGERQAGDKLLYTAREQKSKKLLRKGVTDIEWPPRSLSDVHVKKITRIEVLDNKHDGSGGCASIVNGGPGSNYVKLHLKTQRGGSFDFDIKIYGK